MATHIIAQAIHLHCSKFLLLENLGYTALKTQATAITNAMGRELLQSKSTLLRRRFRMQHNHFNQSRDTPDLLGVRAIPNNCTFAHRTIHNHSIYEHQTHGLEVHLLNHIWLLLLPLGSWPLPTNTVTWHVLRFCLRLR